MKLNKPHTHTLGSCQRFGCLPESVFMLLQGTRLASSFSSSLSLMLAVERPDRVWRKFVVLSLALWPRKLNRLASPAGARTRASGTLDEGGIKLNLLSCGGRTLSLSPRCSPSLPCRHDWNEPQNETMRFEPLDAFLSYGVCVCVSSFSSSSPLRLLASPISLSLSLSPSPGACLKTRPLPSEATRE